MTVFRWSKGMRQKLAIVRALLHRPPLVLLDEPFSGLDPGAALDLRQQLRQLVTEDGTAVLMTTHDLHHVEKICDEVAVMAEQIAMLASGALVFASPSLMAWIGWDLAPAAIFKGDAVLLAIGLTALSICRVLFRRQRFFERP